MRVWNRLALGVFAVVAMPALAFGQQQEGAWGVDVIGGAQGYDSSSGLNTGAFVGAAALYQLSKRFAVGPNLQYTRNTTDASFFTGVLDFGADSARVYNVGQTLNTVHYALDVRFDIMPDKDLDPYVIGGAGGYTMYLETQPNDLQRRVTDFMVELGAGVRWNISDGAGVTLDLRDVMYMGFDRDVLNPIRSVHWNCSEPGNPSSACRFPDAETSTPDKKSTLHNLRFAVGLTFIPGGGN